ncbi:MAG: TolC family protein [Thermodesulfobacteriota bacterium]
MSAADAIWAQGNENLPVDLQALVAEALKANREVKRYAGLKAASQKQISPAGTLDDPVISVNLMNLPVDTWSFSQEPMTQKQIALSQKFPFPGKLRLRSEVAEAQAQADDFTYKDKINEIRAMVIRAYWGLALAHVAFDITAKNKKFWEDVVQVVETRYRVGQGQQSDVLQTQVEMGNYLDRLVQWRQRQASLRAELNALRSEPPLTPIARPQSLKSWPLRLKLNDLLSLAKSRPQLQSLKAMIVKQEKAVDLARKDFYPDFGVELAYGFRDTLSPSNVKQADFFTSKVMVNLPIWRDSKIRPRIGEQLDRKTAAEENYRSAWDLLAAAIEDRYEKLQRLEQQAILYEKGIVPQAQQAAASSLASYQVGALEFARLYQDQIAAYNAELQLQEYLKAFEENWAELEWLVGQELPRRAGGGK